MFKKYHRLFGMLTCCCRNTQSIKDSKQLRILYVNMIKETQEKSIDLHNNKFKGIKKTKPVIVRKVLN